MDPESARIAHQVGQGGQQVLVVLLELGKVIDHHQDGRDKGLGVLAVVGIEIRRAGFAERRLALFEDADQLAQQAGDALVLIRGDHRADVRQLLESDQVAAAQVEDVDVELVRGVRGYQAGDHAAREGGLAPARGSEQDRMPGREVDRQRQLARVVWVVDDAHHRPHGGLLPVDPLPVNIAADPRADRGVDHQREGGGRGGLLAVAAGRVGFLASLHLPARLADESHIALDHIRRIQRGAQVQLAREESRPGPPLAVRGLRAGFIRERRDDHVVELGGFDSFLRGDFLRPVEPDHVRAGALLRAAVIAAGVRRLDQLDIFVADLQVAASRDAWRQVG